MLPKRLPVSLLTLTASFICAVAVLVMWGWIFNVGPLKSLYPTLPPMTFITAVSFFFSGLMLYAVRFGRQELEDKDFFLLLGSLLALSLSISTLLVSAFFGHRSGLEDLFLTEPYALPSGYAPGYPAPGALIGFSGIVLAGLGLLSRWRLRFVFLGVVGAFLVLTGGIAMVRFLLFFTGVLSRFEGMAIHAAILFLLLGFSYLRISTMGKRVTRRP